jgi:hypothetical protein
MLADRPDGRRLTADEKAQLEDLERRLLTGPPAPSRPVPTGLAATMRPTVDRTLLLVGVIAACAMLLVAVLVGGPGGAAATGVALLATAIICRIPRAARRSSRIRGRSFLWQM